MTTLRVEEHKTTDGAPYRMHITQKIGLDTYLVLEQLLLPVGSHHLHRNRPG